MRIRARFAVVPLAAALLLTGCGRPGTAAMIDGERITDAELASVVQQYGAISGEPLSSEEMIFSLAQFDAIHTTAEEFGAGVSEQDAIALLDRNLAERGSEPLDYEPGVIQIAQGSVVLATLQQGDPALYQELLVEATARLSAMDVTINPRFGTWDPTGNVLQDGTVMPSVTPPTNPFLLTAGTGQGE